MHDTYLYSISLPVDFCEESIVEVTDSWCQHTYSYVLTYMKQHQLFIQIKGEEIYTLESKGLDEGALEKKMKSLQYVLSHEAIVGRPTKLQEVRDGKVRKYLTDRVPKKSVMSFPVPSVSNFLKSSVGLWGISDKLKNFF